MIICHSRKLYRKIIAEAGSAIKIKQLHKLNCRWFCLKTCQMLLKVFESQMKRLDEGWENLASCFSNALVSVWSTGQSTDNLTVFDVINKWCLPLFFCINQSSSILVKKQNSFEFVTLQWDTSCLFFFFFLLFFSSVIHSYLDIKSGYSVLLNIFELNVC